MASHAKNKINQAALTQKPVIQTAGFALSAGEHLIESLAEEAGTLGVTAAFLHLPALDIICPALANGPLHPILVLTPTSGPYSLLQSHGQVSQTSAMCYLMELN